MGLLANRLTPAQIVAELDRHIIGQNAAKRAVAIALRNRYRRRELPPEVAEEVIPKNILMIGATGVGKTEIARRLARLAQAPFVKVEATKFTEVGYVGRDVEGMIRDLADAAVRMVEEESYARVEQEARRRAMELVADILMGRAPAPEQDVPPHVRGFQELLRRAGVGAAGEPTPAEPPAPPEHGRDRDEVRAELAAGRFDEVLIEVQTSETRSPVFQVFGGQGEEQIRLEDALGGMLPKQTRTRRVSVGEALEILSREESAKLVDRDALLREALQRAEQDGIVFVDELDKVAGKGGGSGPDVSREGVQRDILPVVEGTTVVTKYGPVDTRHVLFIAAGAFHIAKPSDLIPELQGRFPIRVELQSLGVEDLRRILAEPEQSLLRQYEALLATEGVTVEFRDDAIDELAAVAMRVNQRQENIGARRLHTMLETLLEELSFAAPDIGATTVTVTREYVRQRLQPIVEDEEVSRYIL